MSLALATLIYEWRRYLAAVVALGFAGLLVLAEVGFFMGIGKSATVTIDRSPAEIMVLAPRAESLLNGSSGLPKRVQPSLYMNPQVVSVAELAGSFGQFQNIPEPGTKRKEMGVRIMGVDPFPGSVTLPSDFGEDVRQALLEPYAVALDKTALKSLGVKLGDRALLNGRTIKIAAVLEGYADVTNPTLITSRQTMRMFAMGPRGPRSGPLLVRIRDPQKAEQVRDELNAMSRGGYRAWTRAELSKANEAAMFKEQVIGIMLGFTVVVGVLIGVAITQQTMRGAILASIKEFASLRALGVSMGALRLIIVELSWWVGVAGLVMAGVLIGLVGALASAMGVIMSFPPLALGAIAALLVVIALISGLMALGMLKKSQPADLLR